MISIDDGIIQLIELENSKDIETAHDDADAILLEVLEYLANKYSIEKIDKLIDAWDKVPKYYA